MSPSAALSEFAAALRGLREESGQPSVRDLAASMRAAGQPYPKSTISDKLSGVSKPTWEFVEAYVRACANHHGDPPPELRTWRARYRRLLVDLAASRAGARRAAIADRELATPPTPAGPVPRQLPTGVPLFTGRHTELSTMDGYLDGDRGPAVGLAVLAGTAGVGKTALAVHWAHRVADRFPDGQLYVDLRGYDPDAPLTAGEALSGFLTELGVTDVPYDRPARAARYRSALAGRRMLVVLDNARSVEQVRALLPGTPGCFVVVTSRDRLAGLVARDGAQRIDLDPLPPGDAITLLHGLIGERVAAEPATAAVLAQRCARLPLTLRIAAEHAAARPAASLTALVHGLAQERSPLDAFGNDDDERADVRAVFSWSYRHLPLATAHLFRLLAVHPTGDLDWYAVAALARTDLAGAHELAGVLLAGHLLQADGPDRLRLHDLLRAYAAERSAAEPQHERDAAMGRLLELYLAATATAMDLAFPAERAQRPQVAPASTPVPVPADATAARAWLDAERNNLVAAVGLAMRRHLPEQAAQLAALLWRYLDTGAHHDDALAVHEHALAAARAMADGAEEGRVLNRLGVVHWRWGNHREALQVLERALVLARRAGDRSAEGGVLNSLGLVHAAHGDYPKAVEHLRSALAAAREIGHPIGECSCLDNLARIHGLWGRAGEALDCAQQAVAACRTAGYRAGVGKTLVHLAGARWLRGEYQQARDDGLAAHAGAVAAGDRVGQAMALGVLGRTSLRLGYTDLALNQLRAALEIYHEIGYQDGHAETLNGIGAVYTAAGRYQQAHDAHARALHLSRAEGERLTQAEALNGLGAATFGTGDVESARAHHTEALALAEHIDQWYEQARARQGLGDVYQSLGDTTAANEHRRAALAGYERVGSPEADQVRRLADTADLVVTGGGRSGADG